MFDQEREPTSRQPLYRDALHRVDDEMSAAAVDLVPGVARENSDDSSARGDGSLDA